MIALSSVIAGVLITSLNGGKNAMDALKDAAEAMDKVINVSINGVAALSDKYAYRRRPTLRSQRLCVTVRSRVQRGDQ